MGATGASHIGGSLQRAASTSGIKHQLCDVANAWRHGTVTQKILWVTARRPVALNAFSEHVADACGSFRPQFVITTGIAPVNSIALDECRKAGAMLCNFSTDDPFNPKHRTRWFLQALKQYDCVFSPRMSNIDELRQHGCRDVRYMPFGYDPDLFYPTEWPSPPDYDLFFAGTAEAERVPYLAAAAKAGLKVLLHGSYWHRYAATAAFTLGQADLETLRQGIARSKVALCLVRHENRDGHSMRTFELPPVGTCMLVEDTSEHRMIFGKDDEHVVFFRSPSEMVAKARELVADLAERLRLRTAVQKLIVDNRNTYTDRLNAMLSALNESG